MSFAGVQRNWRRPASRPYRPSQDQSPIAAQDQLRGELKMPNAVAKIMDDLRDRGGLKGTDVANIAEVSPATVSRWTAGKALPHPKTQLIISDLRYIVDRLSEFYAPEETRLWLYSKHRLLEGQRAIDLINRNQADRVLAVIESLDEGTFT
jgi:transcriptional regulator with XRE-family HTH domain